MPGEPSLRSAIERLLDAYGPQHWWPGDSAFEVAAGAVLVQRASWRNAELALTNLRRAGALDPGSIAALDVTRLEELVPP